MAKELVAPVRSEARAGWIDHFFRQAVLGKLCHIHHGTIHVSDPLGVTVCGAGGPSASLQVRDLDFYYLMATKGALGAADGYIKDLWRVDDLYNLVRILVLNMDVLQSLEGGLAKLQALANPVFHYLKRNSVAGSKNNIKAHYDLSDDLFSRFLDPTMMYSAGFYETRDSTLEEAQIAKMERICCKLNLQASDHVVEIGTGWGGFAIYAAQKYGCKITTTTISENQYATAKRRIEEHGLGDRIHLLKKDYRELTGTYDKLVSIEMIEAVGADYLKTYIAKCSDLLSSKGAMVIQAITINDQNYDRALKEVDFIKKYIFPGSFIPCLTAIADSVKAASDLRIYSVEDMTPHYSKTLLDWQERFNRNFEQIRLFGFDDEFYRMWNFYFAYCAGGFTERSIGSLQLVMGKPHYREDLSQRTTYQAEG